MKRFESPEPRTLVLTIALLIGMGLGFHPVFFRLAAMIALGAGIDASMHAIATHVRHHRPAHHRG